MNAAIQELQEKLSAQEEAGNAAETAIATYRTKELELKQRLGTAQASEERLRQELELLRAEQEREGSAAAQLREQHQEQGAATDPGQAVWQLLRRGWCPCRYERQRRN